METIFFYSEYNVPIASVGAKGKKKRTSRKSGRLVVSSKDKIFASA